MGLKTLIDKEASVAAFGDWHGSTLKHFADLDRYAALIAETRPQVIVETGTYGGGSAEWFAAQPGVELVVSVDIVHPYVRPKPWDRIVWVTGSSVDPAVVKHVAGMVGGRSCMVSLDSDHSTEHVAAEIEAYGPLVTPGCGLVVEDGVLAWLDEHTLARHVPGLVGNPLEAIEQKLGKSSKFKRDTATETLSAVSMSPAGWWRR